MCSPPGESATSTTCMILVTSAGVIKRMGSLGPRRTRSSPGPPRHQAKAEGDERRRYPDPLPSLFLFTHRGMLVCSG